MRRRLSLALAAGAAAIAGLLGGAAAQAPRTLVLDGVRIVDGTGAPPIDGGRLVVAGDRIVAAGPADRVEPPAGAERLDLAGRTVTPGLIDLHFHIENDPALALRQLAHGVTAFRDPGQWEEKFEGLRAMIAGDRLPGPRIFTAGPHIDGERPAYPADSVVARDPEEARRLAERNLALGATAIKIYFRLPLASALAVIEVCRARGVPSTAHLEILDARELFAAGLDGVEHITSLGPSLLPRVEAEAYRQAVLKDNAARSEGRHRLFAAADLDGPPARALYAVLREKRPFVDATLAVFERRGSAPPANVKPETVPVLVAGFEKMKQLTYRAGVEGARLVMGGHTEVPFAGRGEAPWRELELLVESGLTPLEALTAATGTAAAFLRRGGEFGTLRPGLKADLLVLPRDPSRDITAIRSVERVMVDGRWVDVAKYRKY
jgi:imidazolonepropionase-like amidohydrolase